MERSSDPGAFIDLVSVIYGYLASGPATAVSDVSLLVRQIEEVLESTVDGDCLATQAQNAGLILLSALAESLGEDERISVLSASRDSCRNYAHALSDALGVPYDDDIDCFIVEREDKWQVEIGKMLRRGDKAISEIRRENMMRAILPMM